LVRKKLDKVVIVDLEATCWDGDIPPDQTSEIIEIGACFLNMRNWEIENKTSYIIKPRYSEVSEFCTQLTTLTKEQVKKGILFGDARNKFAKEFGTRNRSWWSWGDYDRRQFQKNCDLYKVDYPFGSGHMNAKTLFALKYQMSKEPGIAKALGMLGIQFEGTPHRGSDDAYNIARVLRHLLRSEH